ncbi:MAG: threonine-phosphate decarboxylase CobD [Rhizobiaceae bacterium]
MAEVGGIWHGGALDKAIARFGGRREQWLDLSTGINPRPWPVPRLERDAWERLPEAQAETRLLDTARSFYGVGDDSGIALSPGTQALIELLPRLLPGKTAAIVSPASGTYREHANCCVKAGRAVSHFERAQEAKGDIVIVVRPNNPDASLVAEDDMRLLAQRLTAEGNWLIVDEAFCDPVPGESLASKLDGNVIILKSFGKFFGLAGVRLGFAIGPASMTTMIGERFGPWSVSGPALASGHLAMTDAGWIEQTRQWLHNQSLQVGEIVQRHGLKLEGRNGLFVLARTADGMEMYEKLARRHILVRPFPDRPGLLRFGIPGSDDGLARLSAALRETCDRT